MSAQLDEITDLAEDRRQGVQLVDEKPVGGGCLRQKLEGISEFLDPNPEIVSKAVGSDREIIDASRQRPCGVVDHGSPGRSQQSCSSLGERLRAQRPDQGPP